MTAQAREEEEAKRDENFQGIHSLNIYRIRAQPHIYPNNPFSANLSLSVVNIIRHVSPVYYPSPAHSLSDLFCRPH